MTENINMDNQSIAPSQNPSQGGAQFRGGGHAEGETNVPKHSDIKDIEAKYDIQMQDPRIWNQFTRWDRTKLACNPFAPKVDGLEKIKDTHNLFKFKDMYPDCGTHGLKLGVRQSGILEINEHVLHPFVRIHIVDLKTNKWLAKKDKAEPGVANKESCSFFKINDTNAEDVKKEPMKIPVDFFLPMSTQMYDMRVKGVNYCEWNEEFIINEEA